MKQWTLAGVAALALLAGCHRPEMGATGPAAMAERGGIPADCQAEVAVGDRILAAIQNDDYPAFAAALSGDLAEAMTERDFRASSEGMAKQFGKLQKFEFMVALKTPVVKNLVWLVTFERQNAAGETVTQEVLFRLVTGVIEDKINVISLGFF